MNVSADDLHDYYEHPSPEQPDEATLAVLREDVRFEPASGMLLAELEAFAANYARAASKRRE